MITTRRIELLAPAKDKEIGKEAILHGADAIYIGIDGFSARAAAGNSLSDIAELVDFAHGYNVRVYVAVNTILFDNELKEVEALMWQLYAIKVDAVVIQDMGILRLNLPPIPLHASTQADNRTADKVKFLEQAGFTQVVLARELSIGDIAEIASQTRVPLEVFVHGALCVSYSGQCYISQAVTGRSANRGECAQLCRLPYDLEDADGKIIRRQSHMLSLKDFNQMHNLEKLLDAGASSFKIEGRLKDKAYVKNMVAAYRQALDGIMARRPEYIRASSGKSQIEFTPNVSKSFNRGFTDFFANGRQRDIWAFDSPKSVGEFIGTVKSTTRNSITLKTTTPLNNGDGLCFLDQNGLYGFRVNRAESTTIFPSQMPNINIGTKVYRNFDQAFDALLSKPSAWRRIETEIDMRETAHGFALTITDEDGVSVCLGQTYQKEKAKTPQADNIRKQLSKTGNTIFCVTDIRLHLSDDWFIPSSVLTEWRKQLTDRLLSARKIAYHQEISKLPETSHAFPQHQLSYLGNVSNQKSRLFYTQHGTSVAQPAFELATAKNAPLMFSKHCIKYAMGWCPREGKPNHPYREPFYISNKGLKLKLRFNCKDCEMLVESTD